MDKYTLIDTAVNGIMIKLEISMLNGRLKFEEDLNIRLKSDNLKYKYKVRVSEDKVKFIMTEQGYGKDFINYEIEEIIKNYS